MAPGIEENVKNLMEGGWTKYHHIGLVVPLLASLAPLAFSYLPSYGEHTAVRSLLYGVFTTIVAYILFQTPLFFEQRYALQKAILLGLLVSELTIFHIPKSIPSIVIITFFLFMYFFGVAVDKAND
jgi:chromate transport protein ChrA